MTLDEARRMKVTEDAALSRGEKETMFALSQVRPGWMTVDARHAKYIRWVLSRTEFCPEEIMARGDKVISVRGWLPEGYISLRLVPRRSRQHLGRRGTLSSPLMRENV